MSGKGGSFDGYNRYSANPFKGSFFSWHLDVMQGVF